MISLFCLAATFTACAPSASPFAPMVDVSGPAPVERVDATEPRARYDELEVKILRDMVKLRDHHVYSLETSWASYYEFLSTIARPSAEDKVEARRLLERIGRDTRLQIECARALNSAARLLLAHNRWLRTRWTLEFLKDKAP